MTLTGAHSLGGRGHPMCSRRMRNLGILFADPLMIRFLFQPVMVDYAGLLSSLRKEEKKDIQGAGPLKGDF